MDHIRVAVSLPAYGPVPTYLQKYMEAETEGGPVGD